MNYLNIEEYFDNNKYQELLDIYKEDLEVSEEYSNLFSNNALVSPKECQESLTVLTGLYMKFNTVYHIADYQHKKKEQIAKLSTGDKDNLSTVGCYRLKMIFKAYCDNTKKAISTCQSQLKFYAQEIQLTR